MHYSLIKPTKEGLYAALPKDVVFIAKPLLDTLIYRTGSLIGAAYFTWAMNAGLTPKTRQCAPPPTAPTDHTVPRLGPRLGPAPIFATRAPPPLLITSPLVAVSQVHAVGRVDCVGGQLVLAWRARRAPPAGAREEERGDDVMRVRVGW